MIPSGGILPRFWKHDRVESALAFLSRINLGSQLNRVTVKEPHRG